MKRNTKIAGHLDEDEDFLEYEAIREAYEGRPIAEVLLRTVFGFFPEDVPCLKSSITKEIELDGFRIILTLTPTQSGEKP